MWESNHEDDDWLNDCTIIISITSTLALPTRANFSLAAPVVTSGRLSFARLQVYVQCHSSSGTESLSSAFNRPLSTSEPLASNQ